MCLLGCLAFTNVIAQQTMPEVLKAVEQNNKTLATQQQYLETQKKQFRTGLNPTNPVIDYDYLKGSPANAGNQTDITLTQAFDFPTAYGRKRKLANEQTLQAETELTVQRQQILLEAQLTALDLIYHNRARQELSRRIQRVEKLANNYQKQLDKGNISILDVNKARLQLIQIQQRDRQLAGEQLRLAQKLTELTGGQPIAVADTIYPVAQVPPNFEVLDSLIEANDPIVKLYEQQKKVSERQVSVTKALTLPKLETGYHYQSILGQTYKGLHLGVSIPLWENRNMVAAQQAVVGWRESQLQEHRLEHRSLNRQQYSQYENYQASLEAYRRVFTSANNTPLLEKALRLGEISTATFFLELTYLYDSVDDFLITERDYHLTLARLYKFRL